MLNSLLRFLIKYKSKFDCIGNQGGYNDQQQTLTVHQQQREGELSKYCPNVGYTSVILTKGGLDDGLAAAIDPIKI